jgi:hypothetical protein
MRLRRRDPNRPRTDMEALEDFCKAKGLPKPGRIAGGGSRRVYYENPDRVEVIKGLNLPYQSVGRLGVEAERRGMTNVELAEELGLIEHPAPSLPTRIGQFITGAFRGEED